MKKITSKQLDESIGRNVSIRPSGLISGGVGKLESMRERDGHETLFFVRERIRGVDLTYILNEGGEIFFQDGEKKEHETLICQSYGKRNTFVYENTYLKVQREINKRPRKPI